MKEVTDQLCSQFLESQNRTCNHMAQSIEEYIVILATIEPKRQLVQVGF